MVHAPSMSTGPGGPALQPPGPVRRLLAAAARLLKLLFLVSFLAILVAAGVYLAADWRVREEAARLETRLAHLERRTAALEGGGGRAGSGGGRAAPQADGAVDEFRRRVDQLAREVAALAARAGEPPAAAGADGRAGQDGVTAEVAAGRDAAVADLARRAARTARLLALQNAVLKARVELAAGNRGRAADELAAALRLLAGDDENPAGAAVAFDVQEVRRALLADDPAVADRMEVLWHRVAALAVETAAGETGAGGAASAGSEPPAGSN